MYWVEIYLSFFKMNIWKRFIDKLKLMLEEAKASRAIAREQREEIRTVEKEAYHDERLIVAVKEGKVRARRPSGLAGFTAGLQTFSKGLSKIAPPQKGRGKQPTMADLLGGTRTKSKGKSMLDIKF